MKLNHNCQIQICRMYYLNYQSVLQFHLIADRVHFSSAIVKGGIFQTKCKLQKISLLGLLRPIRDISIKVTKELK